jgi:lactate racemase
MRDRLGGVPCELHLATDEEAHGALSEGGREWRLDRRILDADLVVAFGSVEPHYFAGWAGAHKTATIGVAARETIARNHEHALSLDSRPLALDGNPVFDGLRQVLSALEAKRRLLAINHVLDGAGRPLAVGVGTWRGSLQRVLPVAERRFVAPRAEQVDLLVACPEGPLAESLYQADKAIKNHEAVVKSGGDVIVWSEALDSAGSDRFLTLLRAAPDHAAALAEVERAGYVLGDHKAVRLRALEARGVRLHVAAPALDPEALAGTGISHYPSIEEALAALRAPAGRGLVVEDAGVLVSSIPA